MATSVLNTSYLNFNNGATQYARMTAAADQLTLAGAGGTNTVKLSNVTNPTSAQDAATKNYVDSVALGLVWKSPVTACSYGVGNLTLSGTQTVDGVALVAGNRILVAAQTNGVQNGIYVVATGAWSRSTDMPTGSDAASNAVFCQQGTLNADDGFVCTNDTGTAVVGTDALVFIIFTNIHPVVPGGANTNVQYNDSGSFGGVSSFAFNKSNTTPILQVGANAATTAATISIGTGGTNSTGTITIATGTGTSTINAVGTGLFSVTGAGAVTITSSSGAASLIASSGNAVVTGSNNATVTATAGTASLIGSASTAVLAANVTLTSTSGNVVTSAGVNTSITSTSATTITSDTNTVTNTSVTGAMIFKLGDSASATEFRVNNSSNTTEFKVDSGGKGTFTGDVYGNTFNTTSDATYKTNIIPLNNPLEQINKLEGYQYNWKDQTVTQKLQYGVIAQQLEEAGLDHLVSYNDGHKTVNYLGLIPLLIGAVNSLSAKLEQRSPSSDKLTSDKPSSDKLTSGEPVEKRKLIKRRVRVRFNED